jgi:TRAP-type C4-dicarboxylate transport system substrate-binding protein
MIKRQAFFVSFVAIALVITADQLAAFDDSKTSATLLRISLDTGPNHIRNIIVKKFAENLATEMPGDFEVRIFDSGQLYSDRDVVKGLLWGELEMALPSTLHLSRFEPAADVTSLPMFYGQPPDVIHSVLDGELGEAVAAQVEAHLDVEVLTPNLDLGYVNLFSTGSPLENLDDVAGLKIRVPGGIGNIKRLQLQGAYPISIPWSDVSLALSQGNIDAVATTFETLQSSSLWDVGIRFGFEDRAMFIQYVPLLGKHFWEPLDLSVQEIFIRVWRETINEARSLARDRQILARTNAIEHGVVVVTPSDGEITEQRRQLQTQQGEFVRILKVPANIVEIAERHMLNSLEPQTEKAHE